MAKPAADGAGDRSMRVAWSAAIAVVAVVYTAAVIAGWIPEQRQINATHLAVLVAAAISVVLLLRPRALDRLTRLDIAGVKLEMERQADRLDDFSRILPLLAGPSGQPRRGSDVVVRRRPSPARRPAP